ncbi:RecB family nuclease, putative, TM0106 family [Microlunatus sagamiharensis]|uniref:RecB family nuclease, putative, TM0106 family n=1 Tax=Microlunatus sagamiharensis TaxID=546874 RepID=A0A1H2MYS1_9ACTN|nr:RecB family nuclease, putative, TM0106 family [Microlunatus sagamiharensis]
MTAYAEPSPVTTEPADEAVAGTVAEPAVTRGGPLLLDARAARSCPVKTQRRFDGTSVLPPAQPQAFDDPLALRAEAGRRHRQVVLEELIDRCRGRVVDLRLLAADGSDVQVAATRRALADGVDVVVGGVLPPDHDGHRTGTPDLLVRGADGPQGPTYHPALVVWHHVLALQTPRTGQDPVEEGAPGLAWTSFEEPAPVEPRRRRDAALRLRSEERDLRELAHHHRLLEAAGFGGGPAWGGLVGTDVPTGTGRALVWADLAEPLLRTYDAEVAGGYRLETVLERYDGAFARRLAVAQAARRGEPLLAPVVVRECATCRWWPVCRAELDDDDVSVRIDRGALDRLEVEALRGLDAGTVTALAHADTDALLERYLPLVPHRSHAESRLRTAVRRARLLEGGVPFVRETSGPIEVRAGSLEVDLDIESSADGRVYLWGFWVERPDRPDEGSYRAFAAFRDLDSEAETALAVEAFTWLRALVEGEQEAGSGPGVAVYHYSGYEPSTIDALARRSGHPVLAWASAYAREGFVDLLDVVKEHWFGVSGLGLKLVATHAGFAWRDEDPGGLNSQRWFADAVHAPEPEARAAAEARVLAYNEDDVLATRHVRAWLRAAG